MNKAGNFVPVIGKSGTLAQGATPIVVWWDYNALSGRDALNGNPPIEVVVPASGVVAGVYVQAISAYAPHPNAAKLWMEYLYSDEGQLGWLEGYCHPIRFNDMVERGVVPQELLDALPPAAAYEAAVFPTLEEQEAMNAVVNGGWDKVVGANVRVADPADPGATGVRRAAPAMAAPPARSLAGRAALLGLARHRAVPRLRAALPDPADDADRGRRLPHAGGRVHARQRRGPVPAVDPRGLLDLDPDQRRLGVARLRDRLRRSPRR